jgi:hypothetical protein
MKSCEEHGSAATAGKQKQRPFHQAEMAMAVETAIVSLRRRRRIA